jgi:cell wall-associated NlpC family hydrolase
MHWSSEYLNIPWLWRGETKQGCDCLGLFKMIFREKMHKPLPYDAPVDINADYDMYKKGLEVGDEIKDISDLREFDLAFFLENVTDAEPRHMGIMVNNFGKFIQQLENRVTSVSDINNAYWKKRFYTGIRVKREQSRT